MSKLLEFYEESKEYYLQIFKLILQDTSKLKKGESKKISEIPGKLYSKYFQLIYL